MNRPTYCYLGITKDGKLEIMVSERSLNPLGTRFLKGDHFPAAVYDFYQQQPMAEKFVKDALAGAEAYLRGEAVGTSSLTIGDTSALNTKRRKKS